ncbi:helix-turn-helix domain-containing protein [Paenibacillus qinlingensis]|uniref:AraC-like DNA-binding protein n=1 Tax=Paenibacillus qinlingensis TaxID=1837343 RepID=A0ABU1P126_9BACL|nr:helix-turn-helix domain-containing protein [Paenibacillus qinlingensis]MDR6553436.1 AraC-like DNA-binding protein [Paenibacillus qinlingensis]
MKVWKNMMVGSKLPVRFTKYFISYVILTVMLLFIVSAIVYVSIFASLQKQIEASNISSMLQIRDVIDARFQEMERVSVQITSNSHLASSLLQTTGYEALQVVNELQRYSSSMLIRDLALYYKDKHSDRIFAASGIYNIDDFFSEEYRFESLSKADFLSTITSLKVPQMKPVQNVTLRSSQKSKALLHLYPIPSNSQTPYGFVMFIIDEKSINNIFENAMKGRRGLVSVLDENYVPIIAASSGVTDQEQAGIIKQMGDNPSKQQISTLKTSQGKYSIITVPSQVNRLSYVSAVPTTLFMQPANKSLYVFAVMVLFVLLFGVAVGYLLAFINYKPIKRLVSSLQLQMPSKSFPEFGDELAYVSKAFDQVAAENTHLLNNLKDKNYMLKEHLLLNLLKGKYDTLEQLNQYLAFADIKLEQYRFTVLQFLIDDFNEFMSGTAKSLQEMLKFGVVDILEEMSTEYGVGFGINLLENNGVALILGIDYNRDLESTVNQLAAKTKEHFKDTFEVTLTVGVGGVYNELLMVYKSFLEASRAAEYRFVKGTNQVIFYHKINALVENNKYNYPLHLESNLMFAIKQGRGEDIEPIISEIMNAIIEQPISPEAVQSICFGIISTIVKTLDAMNISTGSTVATQMVELYRYKFETIEGLRERMTLFCKNVCIHIENQKESKNFGLREKIISYVQANCYNNTLSLEMIAGTFGVSASYLTRYFKDQTGYPLMKYIDNIRMEKAKQLLKSTDLTYKGIIEQCGYTDETNFIRKFKSIEGMTPQQYRQLSKPK